MILDIDVPAGETTIHYESQFGWIDTGASPPNLGTSFLEIMIDGLGGHDNVNLSGMGDADGGWNSLMKSLIFDGGDGNDTFTSPTGPLVPPYPSGPQIVFLGGNGVDTFNGGNSAEHFHGGADGDTAHGGGGDDILEGDPAGYVGVAKDTLYGDGGNDTITGGYYMDDLYGGDDADVISGGDGDDFIDGGNGNDSINGGAGADSINGGNDNDEIFAGPGRDTVLGGHGDDTITGSGIEGEVINGDVGNDTIVGSEGPDTIDGWHGQDSIYGYGGADTINGGGHVDYIVGGDGIDTIHGNEDGDTIFGGADGDFLYGDGGADTIYGQGGPDSIHGGDQGDAVYSNDVSEIDQPYMGAGPNPSWPDMRGTGEADCDLEDGHEDMDPGCPPPMAVNDEYGITSNDGAHAQVAAPGVLINDLYADAVELVPDTGPSHGSLIFNSDGSLDYVPTPGFMGDDTFQYLAIDTASGKKSLPATVTISVIIMPLMLARPEVESGAPPLTDDRLAPLVREATRSWRSAGVDDETIEARLAGLAFVILDLPGSQLGGAMGSTIFIDINAAGYGWFVDATPGDDREFRRIVSSSQKEATGGSVGGQADLLTVLAHEIGHVLGLDHGHGDATNVMADTLGLGTRRNPTVLDAAIADYLYWESQRRR